MTRREKILAAVVLASLVLFGGTRLKARYDGALAGKQAQIEAARQRLIDAQKALLQGRAAQVKLRDWRERSLPADAEVARSLYRTWLLERSKQAGVAVDDIQPNQRLAGNDAFTVVGYTLTARGSIAAFVKLLYDFYRSPLLQQITRLQIRTDGDSSRLVVTLQCEALALAGATTEQIPDGDSQRLAKSSAEDYVASFGGRNLLAAYQPPRAEPAASARNDRPAEPPFDAAKHAYVTGIVEVGGRLQAWITVRTTGEVLRLYEGDPVKVGLLDGKIVAIGPRMVIVESGDEQTRIELGRNLRDGKAVPAQDG